MISERAFEIMIICFSTIELSHTNSIAINELLCHQEKPFVVNTRYMNMSGVKLVS